MLWPHFRFSGLLAHFGELLVRCFKFPPKILSFFVVDIMGLLHTLDIVRQSIVSSV